MFERDHYIKRHIEKLGKKPNIIGMYWPPSPLIINLAFLDCDNNSYYHFQNNNTHNAFNIK